MTPLMRLGEREDILVNSKVKRKVSTRASSYIYDMTSYDRALKVRREGRG